MKMKKFVVTFNQHYTDSVEIEAESAEQALEVAKTEIDFSFGEHWEPEYHVVEVPA